MEEERRREAEEWRVWPRLKIATELDEAERTLASDSLQSQGGAASRPRCEISGHQARGRRDRAGAFHRRPGRRPQPSETDGEIENSGNDAPDVSDAGDAAEEEDEEEDDEENNDLRTSFGSGKERKRKKDRKKKSMANMEAGRTDAVSDAESKNRCV